MNNQELDAHNAAFIAVLVLGNNGHLSFTHALQTREQKLGLPQMEESLSRSTHKNRACFHLFGDSPWQVWLELRT